MFSGGISASAVSAFRTYLQEIKFNGDYSAQEISAALVTAGSTIDGREAARILGTAGPVRAGIHGGSAQYTRALSRSSRVSDLEIAAKAFMYEKMSHDERAKDWTGVLGDFMPVEGGR